MTISLNINFDANGTHLHFLFHVKREHEDIFVGTFLFFGQNVSLETVKYPSSKTGNLLRVCITALIFVFISFRLRIT